MEQIHSNFIYCCAFLPRFLIHCCFSLQTLHWGRSPLSPTHHPLPYNGYKYVRIRQNKTQTRSTSCRSRVTNECDIRFVNGNNEPLYIYNLSEELSILFNYYYKAKSKIVINGKANIVYGIL